MILGIDPGSRITGYGFIRIDQTGKLSAIDWGHIAPPAALSLSERVGVMGETVSALVNHFRPEIMAVEAQFVYLNPQSALKLGLVRGAILLAAHLNKVATIEYSPALIKKRCSGHGRANKRQMAKFIASLLGIDECALQSDAADALAIAYCHWRQEGGNPLKIACSPPSKAS